MLNLNVSENAMLRTVRHVGQNGTAMYTMCTQVQTMSIFMIIFSKFTALVYICCACTLYEKDSVEMWWK